MTAEEVRARIERLQTYGKQGIGAAIVARAWEDEGFKQRLLDDASTAAAELGFHIVAFPQKGGKTGTHMLILFRWRRKRDLNEGKPLARHAVQFVVSTSSSSLVMRCELDSILHVCCPEPSAGNKQDSVGHAHRRSNLD